MSTHFIAFMLGGIVAPMAALLLASIFVSVPGEENQ